MKNIVSIPSTSTSNQDLPIPTSIMGEIISLTVVLIAVHFFVFGCNRRLQMEAAVPIAKAVKDGASLLLGVAVPRLEVLFGVLTTVAGLAGVMAVVLAYQTRDKWLPNLKKGNTTRASQNEGSTESQQDNSAGQREERGNDGQDPRKNKLNLDFASDVSGNLYQRLERAANRILEILNSGRTLNSYQRMSLFQGFMEALVPVLNDPTNRLNISEGHIEIVFENGNLFGFGRSMAEFIGEFVNNTTGHVDAPYVTPCHRGPNCKFCSVMKDVQSQISQSGEKKSCNCETTHAIYSFYCRICSKQIYVGKTTNSIHSRMSTHVSNPTSGIHRHAAREHDDSAINDASGRLIYDIQVMWGRPSQLMEDDSSTDALSEAESNQVVRNWEVILQWISNAHESQGGDSMR